MITLKKSNNIFYNRRIILDYFSNDISNSGQELENINWFELKISGINNDKIFDEFLLRFIDELKGDFFINFISFERQEALKNRMRSYAKHYYSLRKAHLINDKYIAEKEINTSENKSIFAGIIRVDEIDNDIIQEELLENYGKLIHAELEVDLSTDHNYVQGLLNKIDIDLLKKDNLIDVNYLVLMSKFVNRDSMIFNYMYDGKDDLIFSIYAGNRISNQVELFLLESFPKTYKIECIEASSKEVDRLIESYFRDWERVKS